MITTLVNQKRGLNRLSQLADDGDPWAPNNLLKPGAKEETPVETTHIFNCFDVARQ